MTGAQQVRGATYQQGYYPQLPAVGGFDPQQIRGLRPQQVYGPQAQFPTQTTDWMTEFMNTLMQIMPLIMMAVMMSVII